MEPKFEDKKLIASHNIDVPSGSFALESPFRFETCRERFAKSWDENTRGWYFKHEENKGLNVASFLNKTEKILDLKEFSVFAKTNRKTILWIEPSDFWKECRMKRSLLTILVRAGILYEINTDNYEEALFQQTYLAHTKNAVLRFLFGFTKYIGPDIDSGTTLESKGWKTIFDGKDCEYVKRNLIFPESNCYIPVYKKEDALWIQ